MTDAFMRVPDQGSTSLDRSHSLCYARWFETTLSMTGVAEYRTAFSSSGNGRMKASMSMSAAGYGPTAWSV